ncbi:Uncharacterised protein [Mycobacteroides abscessus subsp. abscessus]|nr:Uncharacterised protein [Mycobacteroides abscessus subsp. abscessus]
MPVELGAGDPEVYRDLLGRCLWAVLGDGRQRGVHEFCAPTFALTTPPASCAFLNAGLHEAHSSNGVVRHVPCDPPNISVPDFYQSAS